MYERLQIGISFLPISFPLPHIRDLNRKRRVQRITTSRISTSAILRVLTKIVASPTVTSTFSSDIFHRRTERQSHPIAPVMWRTTTRKASKWTSKGLLESPIWRETPGSGGPCVVHIPIFPRRSCPAEIRSYRPLIPSFPANTCSGELTTYAGTCFLNMVWPLRRGLWTHGQRIDGRRYPLRVAVCDVVTRNELG